MQMDEAGDARAYMVILKPKKEAYLDFIKKAGKVVGKPLALLWRF